MINYYSYSSSYVKTKDKTLEQTLEVKKTGDEKPKIKYVKKVNGKTVASLPAKVKTFTKAKTPAKTPAKSHKDSKHK